MVGRKRERNRSGGLIAGVIIRKLRQRQREGSRGRRRGVIPNNGDRFPLDLVVFKCYLSGHRGVYFLTLKQGWLPFFFCRHRRTVTVTVIVGMTVRMTIRDGKVRIERIPM